MQQIGYITKLAAMGIRFFMRYMDVNNEMTTNRQEWGKRHAAKIPNKLGEYKEQEESLIW
jgi:hypothetical protein